MTSIEHMETLWFSGIEKSKISGNRIIRNLCIYKRRDKLRVAEKVFDDFKGLMTSLYKQYNYFQSIFG